MFLVKIQNSKCFQSYAISLADQAHPSEYSGFGIDRNIRFSYNA